MNPQNPVGPENSPGGPESRRSFFVQKSAGRPGLVYEPVQRLGEGAFGVAHLVRDKRTNQMRVLKTIGKRQSQVPPAQMEREICNLKACDHPHIIRLFEYYEDYENVYLVMERAAGGELHQVLQEQRKKNMQLPERWVSVVMRQCIMAITYVHSMGIIHKDLKSENLLLLNVCDVNDPTSQPHAVIIDLGIAELFSARLGRRARCTVVAGTPTHMAPEVWRGSFGPVADVWSLGVVLFENLCGELPFMCGRLNGPDEWVRLHRQGPNWAMLAHCSNQARALNQRMLSCDERMRPTAQQCLGHSWFKDDAAGEALAPDGQVAGMEVPQGSTPRSPRPPAENFSERLQAYQGRSKFEKAVLLQVASQLHTAQIGRIGDIFIAADSNRNGVLEKPELLAALRKLGVDPADAESYVSCLDSDANGFVEYTEFAAGCVGLLYEDLRGLLWQSFCVIDVDGNGVLGREEVRAVVTHADLNKYGFPCGRDDGVDEVLQRMDVDNNGQISFDELCRHFLPARPSLPSPVYSPRAARNGSGDAEAAGGDEVGGVAALKDEDFAQLLDEIEADHAKPAPQFGLEEVGSNGMGSGVGEGAAFPSPFDGAYLAPFNGAPSGLPDVTTDTLVAEMSLPLGVDPEDSLLVGACALAPEAPAELALTAADVDEELNSLLADIANGP